VAQRRQLRLPTVKTPPPPPPPRHFVQFQRPTDARPRLNRCGRATTTTKVSLFGNQEKRPGRRRGGTQHISI
jgi:hypothetical protein